MRTLLYDSMRVNRARVSTIWLRPPEGRFAPFLRERYACSVVVKSM